MAVSPPIFVLTDLHGCFYTMLRLLNAAPHGARLVFAGDLIDRGPHSRKVVEFAMQHGIPTVRANHDDLCIDFYYRGQAKCSNMYARDVWLENGGLQTLKNWPVTKVVDKRSGWHGFKDGELGGRVPESVLDWFKGLPAYLTPSDVPDSNGRRLLVSHTGYGLDADNGDWFMTLWGRYDERDGGDGEFPKDNWFRVFGHTRTPKPIVTTSYACIDTGAAYKGGLTAFMWPTKEVYYQPYDETPVVASFSIRSGVLCAV